MMTVFVGLILFMIVVFMIVNGSFLEKYYISNKKSEFIKAYTMVQEGVENGTIDSETPEKAVSYTHLKETDADLMLATDPDADR